ncbi:unnamed protein product [Eretmochelys imbricata]
MLPCHKPGNLQLSWHSPRPAAAPGQAVCSPRGHGHAVVFSPFGRHHDLHCLLQRWDLPYTVSRESAGTFSCRYQLKDDNNEENNSLPSDARYLHVDESAAERPDQRAMAFLSLRHYEAEPERRRLDPREADDAMALPGCGVITASPHDPAAGPMASLGGGKVRVQERATGMMRGLEQLPDSERLTEVRLLQARKFVALQTPMERAPWDVLAIVRYSSDPQHLPSHRKWPIDVGTLPAPRLFLDRLSAHEGDTAMLSCLVPCGIPVTRIVFCKDGKEISVQPKGGNTVVYDSPYTVSKESAGAFSCLYQLKDDNNQENNSLSSDPRYLPVDGGDGSGGDASAQGLGPIVGLAIMAGLALALLGCFLMKTVVSRCRTHREPDPDRSSPAAEDQIQSSAQPNDKVTGAVGRGQERDWLEPGSFCHKLQGATPTTPTGCGSQPMGAAELALGAGAACGAPWLPLCIGVMGGHAAFSRCCTEPGQPPGSLSNRAFQAKTRHLTTLSNTGSKLDTVVTGARADQPRMDGDVAVTYAVVGKVRSQVRDTQTAPIPSAPQACMSPTLAASLIGAPGKEMVMEPVNQPARTSVWVNR